MCVCSAPNTQLLNISRDLGELKVSLRLAAAGDQDALQRPSTQPTFPSAEAAVQSVLESLRNRQYTTAIRHIRQCRSLTHTHRTTHSHTRRQRDAHTGRNTHTFQGISVCAMIIQMFTCLRPIVSFCPLSPGVSGRTTSSAVTRRTRSTPCCTSPSVTSPWVRRACSPWWVSSRMCGR